MLQYISAFSSLTGATVRDCINGDPLLFIVKKGDLGLAIGKGGQNLRRAEEALRRGIKVVEYDDDMARFVENCISPIRAQVTAEGSRLSIRGRDMKTRSRLIGRDRANLKSLTAVVKRLFPIDSIEVN